MNRKRWSCTTIRCRKGWGKKHRQHLAGLPWVPAGVTKQIWETNVPAGVGIKTKRQK